MLDLRTFDRNQIIQQRDNYSINEKLLTDNAEWWESNKRAVTSSWKNNFFFREETIRNEITVEKGLRNPQLGAIYAALSHWTTPNEPGIIVMPTGTGKTETMLSLLIKQQIEKLLVIVPSDSLRKQIGDKFVTLGELKNCHVAANEILHPIVGRLYHKVSTVEQVDILWQRCHVIITTIDSLNACNEAVRQYFAETATHVFVDEAHHSAAPVWQNFLKRCQRNRLLLFTATPFREDGKKLNGKRIYNYPLSSAQQEGYFRYINLCSIRQHDQEKADRDLAEKAVETLEKDLKAGYDHVVMARVRSIAQAEIVSAAYAHFAKYNPVIIHSELKESDRKQRINALLKRESRIAICVNMLGEGFDLPNLKIAAIHECHQSWTVFLQFIGRFIRNRTDLGDATVILNEASSKLNNNMNVLYNPGSDWNSIIRLQSHSKIGKEIKKQECYDGFIDVPFNFSIDQIFPKTSVVTYQLPPNAVWMPENCTKGFKDDVEVKYCLNADEDLLVICAKHTVIPGWTDSMTIQDIEHDLFAIYYDRESRLIFLHCSNTDTYHENLADAIGGKGLVIIKDDCVFRCFDEIYELRLFNVGLSETLGTQIRYTMHVGPNVEEGLTEILTTNKQKANLFGTGSKDGKPFSIGGSYKGRIWSRLQYDLTEFKEWCQWVKSKILDESIDTSKIIKNVWMPETLSFLPDLTTNIPIYIDWPEDFYKNLTGHKNLFFIGDKPFDWLVASIQLGDISDNEIHFLISVDDYTAKYRFTIVDGKAIYELKDGTEVLIKPGREKILLQQYFQTNPVRIRYSDLSYINNTVRYRPPTSSVSQFSINKIDEWDWEGIDIKKESQRLEKRPDSIQRRVILELLQDTDYCIIYDDDNSGEAADVIAIKEKDDYFSVELYHLKFSKSKIKGKRIDDLYTVCGQAQRSGIWQNPKMKLVNHLRDREYKRIRKSPTGSRFEKGELETLYHLENLQRKKPFQYSIFAVQPGLSKAKVTSDQLIILGITETYLMLAYKIPFRLIASS